jgi:hypothetical protein
MKAIVEDHDFVCRLGRDATVVELDKEELFALFWIVAEAIVKGRGCEEIGAIVCKAITVRETTLTEQISVLDGLEAPTITVPALSLFERPFAGEYIRAKV